MVIQCEICGGGDFIKTEGYFVCQGCGMKFSAEEIRGMLTEKKTEETATVKQKETLQHDKKIGIVNVGEETAQNFVKRAFLALEEIDWDSARRHAEKALDHNAECAEAYLIQLLVRNRETKVEELARWGEYRNCTPYKLLMRYADDDLRAKMQAVEQRYLERLEKERREKEELRRKEEKLQGLRDKYSIVQNRMIAASWRSTVAVKMDGTVLAVGENAHGNCDVAKWRDVVAVFAGDDHTFGIKKDGTVAIVGKSDEKRDKIAMLKSKDIIAVRDRWGHIACLTKHGTVLSIFGGYRDTWTWKDIVMIATGEYHMVGLKKDGTVVVEGNRFRDHDRGQFDVSDWNNIVAVATGYTHTVGLKKDGTVVAVGDNTKQQCNVSEWSDIIAIDARGTYTVGLKKDGTVVAVGDNAKKQCNVSAWRDIVAIAAGIEHTVGVKRDGTVVAVGNNKEGVCNVKGWKLFNDIETLEAELKEIEEKKKQEEEEKKAEKKRKAQEKKRQKEEEKLIKQKRREANLCQYCGGVFKGILKKTCVSCGRKKDY